MITFNLEPWAAYRRDCEVLWAEHYDEIASDKDRMPMRPDDALYEQLERSGQLQITVGRKNTQMAGYMLFIVRPHPHYADILCGFEDAYFLGKEHRTGVAGINLIKVSIAALKKRGVKRWFIHTKTSRDVGRILSFLGGIHTDEIYSAWIGD